MMLSEIATFIGDNTALTIGVDLFAVEMPPMPDSALSIHEYEGTGPTDTFGTFSAYEESRLHIRARGVDYPTAMALSATVDSLVYSITDTTIGGHLYSRVAKQGSWVVTEIDTQARVVVSCNFRVTRVP